MVTVAVKLPKNANEKKAGALSTASLLFCVDVVGFWIVLKKAVVNGKHGTIPSA